MGPRLIITLHDWHRGYPEMDEPVECPRITVTSPTGESFEMRWCDKGLEIKGATGRTNIINNDTPVATHIDVVVGDSNTLFLKPG